MEIVVIVKYISGLVMEDLFAGTGLGDLSGKISLTVKERIWITVGKR